MPPVSSVIQFVAEMQEETMKKIKFVVKLNHSGFRVRSGLGIELQCR
jgi:hypothetical protein